MICKPMPFSDDDLKTYIMGKPRDAECGNPRTGDCLIEAYIHETTGKAATCGFTTLRVYADEQEEAFDLSDFTTKCIHHFVDIASARRTFGALQDYVKTLEARGQNAHIKQGS